MKDLYFICFLFSLVLTSCVKDEPNSDNPVLVDITDMNQFEQRTKEGVSLIFFHATWCSLCKNQRPEVESLLLDDDLSSVFFGEVNYEQVSEVVDHYEVLGFPTLIFFKDGKEEDRMIGANNKAQKLKDRLMELMN